MPRLHVDMPLALGSVELDAAARRHVQVLRLRPGDAVTLFDGRGGEWEGVLAESGTVELRAHLEVERELGREVVLAVGMPANDRMDGLVEKAVELGAAAIQPLMTARSVLRLDGERAERRTAHWRGVAVAACEQCGRNRPPRILPPLSLARYIQSLTPGAAALALLAAPAQGRAAGFGDWVGTLAPGQGVIALSGPEGGFDRDEVESAVAAGFQPLSLGPRVLRADTAPLAWLAQMAVLLR